MRLIDHVKAQVPLESLLQSEGFVLKKMSSGSSGSRSDSCPHCGTKKNSNRLGVRDNRYHCFSCGGRGDVIDAAAAIHHLSVMEAARWLEREFWVAPQREPVVRQPPGSAEPPVTSAALKRLIANLHEMALTRQPTAMRYLNETRGVPMDVIEAAVEQGVIRFLPDDVFKARDMLAEAAGGQEMLVETRMLRPEKKVPAAAFRPIVWFLDGMDSIEFRVARAVGENDRKALRYGSATKPSSFRPVSHDPSVKTTAFTEGLIDMLSMAALGFRGEIRGLPGVNVWLPEWFSEVDSPVVCFDGDRGGRRAAEKVRTVLLEEHQKTVQVQCPPSGDINDLLIARNQNGTQSVQDRVA